MRKEKPMTNADKYLKDGVDVGELASKINELMLFCQNYTQPFRACLVEFFKKEVKPTLTEDEKVLLRNLPTKYEFIGRNYSGILQLSEISKFKTGCYCWDDIDELFNHLFQFIQPRRRI